jgi:paraquat-inducible protein B
MGEDQPQSQGKILPSAVTLKRRRIPLIWLVPAITALIALWLAYDTWSKQGPTITVTFESGSGLQPGQSQLKYKDITMGTVKSIEVTPDYSKVTVTIETVHAATRFLKDNTTFWVVKPQLFAGRVSGLDTLLSGSYVAMLPQAEGGKPARQFAGSEDPPILTANVPGTTFKLEARRLRSISLGAPIFYRDLEVGTVLGWDLGHMARSVTIHAFVRAPFDQYVHEDTQFWNASGIAVRLGGEGVKVEMESFRAVLLGGIAFETRPGRARQADPEHSFQLYPNRESARSAGYARHLSFVSYFEGSVAGLGEGSDVTLHGLKIGEVNEVELTYDPKVDRILAAVHFEVQGDRITGITEQSNIPAGTYAAIMVERGLRATLEAPSLISPGKIIALQFLPNAPKADLLRGKGEEYIMPTGGSGGFESLTRAAGELMSKINSIDFAAIGAETKSLMQGLDDKINGPQMKNTLDSLEATMKDLQNFMRRLDVDSAPALARLPAMADQLEGSLGKVNKLAGSLNTAYGDESRFSRELDRLLPQLNEMARSFRALADLLARHPEALIKGRTSTGKE